MDARQRFEVLHRHGFFVMPNAWDIGSAVRLERLGFDAIATTSSGHAASLGKSDQEITFDELCVHVEDLVGAVEIPVSVDSERLFAPTPDGIGSFVDSLAAAGASGLSIEDYDPATSSVDAIDVATDRVAAAAEAAHRHGIALTARAENHLYANGDLDDTIHRLLAYARAGADIVYAPGIVELADLTRLVDGVDRPLNVLLRPGGLPLVALADLGVRRVSTGGRLAHTAYGAMETAAKALLTETGVPGDHA